MLNFDYAVPFNAWQVSNEAGRFLGEIYQVHNQFEFDTTFAGDLIIGGNELQQILDKIKELNATIE